MVPVWRDDTRVAQLEQSVFAWRQVSQVRELADRAGRLVQAMILADNETRVDLPNNEAIAATIVAPLRAHWHVHRRRVTRLRLSCQIPATQRAKLGTALLFFCVTRRSQSRSLLSLLHSPRSFQGGSRVATPEAEECMRLIALSFRSRESKQFAFSVTVTGPTLASLTP